MKCPHCKTINESIIPAKLTTNIKSDYRFVYHATNEESLYEIIRSGQLSTYRPWHGTDQTTWPDGSREKRAYFSPNASIVWQFAPDHGKPVIIRIEDNAELIREHHTGDVFSRKPIKIEKIEYLGEDDSWHPLSALQL